MQQCRNCGSGMRRIRSLRQPEYSQNPIPIVDTCEAYQCVNKKCKATLFRSTWTCGRCGKIHSQDHEVCGCEVDWE